MSGIIDSLLPVTDAILGVRDSIGAQKTLVYFLTRTWYTDQTYTTQSADISGYAKDVTVQVLPSPNIVDLTKQLHLKEGGMAEGGGDVLLKSISRNKYNESQLDGSSPSNNVECLYLIGVKVYQVIRVTQDYLTWNVLLKRLSNQSRY